MYVRVMYAAIYSIIHACTGLYAGDVGRDVNIWCFFWQTDYWLYKTGCKPVIDFQWPS